MIILDGNVFYAEVKDDRNTGYTTLVKGHSGHLTASRLAKCKRKVENQTAEWIGSNYISNIAKFANNPFNYLPHEDST